MDELLRKWQNQYGISNEAFHALRSTLLAWEQISELESHRPVANPTVGDGQQQSNQSGSPSNGPIFDERLFSEIIARQEYGRLDDLADSWPYSSNPVDSFPGPSFDIEESDAAHRREFQSFPVEDDPDFWHGGASIPGADPFRESTHKLSISMFSQTRLPDGQISDDNQVTEYQYCSPVHIPSSSSVSPPSKAPQRPKRNLTLSARECPNTGYNKRRKPTKQCIRCWYTKKTCNDSLNVPNQCSNCISAGIPQQVCIRTRLANDSVFLKWKDAVYSAKLTWAHLDWKQPIKHVTLRHEDRGPTITVAAQEFRRSSQDAICLYWKDRDGWKHVKTTRYGLTSTDINLEEYISQNANFYLSRLAGHPSYVGQILYQLTFHLQNDLIARTLGLWTANRLLMKGWEITGDELLEMSLVQDENSPLHDTYPTPRVMQNQLDRMLESYICEAEQKILKDLQIALQKKSACSQEVICLSMVILLHVLESDSWRLMFWKYHRQERYRWRHPSSPETLIDKNMHFANMMVTYMRCAGAYPKDLMSKLRDILKPNYLYKERDEKSIEGSLSSLVLEISFDELASAEKFFPSEDGRSRLLGAGREVL